MKKILFSLLILAIYASANTCTEAWFEIYTLSQPKNNAVHPDSVYYKTNNKDGYAKYIYRNEQLEQIIINMYGESEDTNMVYLSKDENILTKKGSELLISDSVVGDTLFYFQKVFKDGVLVQEITRKITKQYASERNYEPVSDKRDSSEYFFRNDTLIRRVVDYYNTEFATESFIYYVGDSTDDFKCYEYRDRSNKDVPSFTLIYQKNNQGYSLKYFEDEFIQEYFMVYPDGTTAIHKRRAPVKVSPKARYFDLLGRYKFTR